MPIRKPGILILVIITLFTFLWSQFLWAGGYELYRYPTETTSQKNLPNNIQEKSPKDSRILAIISQITIPGNFINPTPNISPSPTLKECTEGIDPDQFLAFLTPQIPPQIYPLGGQSDRLGRVQEKYGRYDNKSYSWQAITYDELGRPTAYKEKIGKVSYRHYDIQYNELGDVSYEKIKVTAKSGTGIFSSKSTVVTEYKYGYDEYGQHEKIWENEIYRKVSSNPIGTIVKAIVSIIIIAATWGMATPVVAAWMAASNFVFALLSGASLQDALIGAAISFAAAVIGAQLGAAFGGGASAATSGATGFAGFLKEGGMTMFFQALSLADSLMVDDEGRGLFEQLFGEWGSIVFDVISVLVALKSGTGNKGPPYQLYAALGRLAVSAILTALGDKIDPRLRQFISAFTTSFLNAWANAKTEQAKFKQALGENAPEGNLKIKEIKDSKGNVTGYDITSADGKFKAELTADLKLRSIIDQDGNLTRFDEKGIPIYTKLTNGDLIAYDIDGNQMAYLKQGSEPVWENGKIIRSKTETDLGTTYYDNKSQFEAFIPEGNEPMYNAEGRITSSYKDQDGTTYIYNERGQLDSSITPATSQGKVQGYYIDTGITTTYTDNQGNPIWYRNNTTSNSPVYFLDPFNQTVSGQLLTKLDENGLTQGYIYQDFQKNEYTFYDQNGEQLLPAINPENIKQNLTNVVIKLKEILTNQLDDIKEQYNLVLNSSHEIDLTRAVSAIESLIDTLPLSPSVGSILLNLLVNTDDILQNIRLQDAINAKDINLIYDETKYTPEQIKQALNNYIANLKEQIPSRWELFKDELRQRFTLPEGVSLAGMGMVGTVIAGEPTQITKILTGAAILGYGVVVISQSAWRSNTRYKDLISGFEASRISSKDAAMKPAEQIRWDEGVPAEPVKLPDLIDPATEPIKWQEGIPAEPVKLPDLIDPATEPITFDEGMPAHQRSLDDLILKADSQNAGTIENINVTANEVTATRRLVGTSDKVAVIGRDMDKRVVPFAEGINAETFKPSSKAIESADLGDSSLLMEENRAWVQKLKTEGYTVYDTGLDPKYTSQGNYSKGPYYDMETRELFGD